MFFFQAEDGIRDLVRSRGLGDVYKRQTRLNVAPGTVLEEVPGVLEEVLEVPVGAEPDGSPVTVDVTVFRPSGSAAGAGSAGPWPAVVLAHGFGGSKADLVERGRDLASRCLLYPSPSPRDRTSTRMPFSA